MENATDKQIAFLKKKNVDARQMSKQQAHEIISNIVDRPKEEVLNLDASWDVKPKKNSQSSFYVAYAKDMCIALSETLDVQNQEQLKQLMQDCIDCIKLAKEQL